MVPKVAIIVPVHNDAEFISSALDSCLAQTSKDFEVICVDDASTDGTVAIIEEYVAKDPRIQLRRLQSNSSAFHARRIGITATDAPYVLFLDGDDELTPDAVEATLRLARSEGADVVGFGVTVIAPDGSTGGGLEQSLQPKYSALDGGDILRNLFPVGRPAQGHIWKYLWSRELLEAAYANLPETLKLYRSNDLPISLLSMAGAEKYVSTSEKFLKYYWRRGTSGHDVEDLEAFEFYLSGLTSIDSIRDSVHERIARSSVERGELLRDTFESARLGIIGNQLRYWTGIVSEDLRRKCLELLLTRASKHDVIKAAATFHIGSIGQLVRNRDLFEQSAFDPPKSILLTATDLSSGGAQGVVVSQAQYLVDAGYRVVISVRSDKEVVYKLPAGVELVRVWGETPADRIDRYVAICELYDIDIAIDHWILYRDDWPFYALAASTVGVRTIGWIHSFALRPIFDANQRISFLTAYLPLLYKVVTLSKADAAFWKMRGIDSAIYLPNPPSPLLQNRDPRTEARELGDEPVQLVWWGRLQQSVKRVRELIDVAVKLRALDVDFRLKIIGPDSADLTADALLRLAESGGVADAIEFPGALHGDSLHDALSNAHIFVYTSAIEGYPLTLVEAQSLGLPVLMFELPWLAVLEGNKGVASVPQYDSGGLAQLIAEIYDDHNRYREMSQASLEAAENVLSYDFVALYSLLIEDELPGEYSPTSTLEDSKILLDRAIDYSELQFRSVRRREGRLRRQISELRDAHSALTQNRDQLEGEIAALSSENERLAAQCSELREHKAPEPTILESLGAENESLRIKNDRLRAKVRRQRARVVELTRIVNGEVD